MNISKILQENIKFLCEDENQAVKDSHNESIDLQIDKKFIEFEKKSQTSDQTFENFFFSSNNLLHEEKDDEEKEESEESESQEAPERLTTEDIDINQFASDIVRLIENFSNLIEIRDTVVRRSLKFLSSSYDEEVLKLFEETLKEEFGIEEDKTVYDQNYEIQAPRADRAGSSM